MRRIVMAIGLVVLVASTVGAPSLAAQQSVGVPNAAPPPSRADIERAREATAFKCLTAQAVAAQALNSPGEPRMAKRPLSGGLGLGALNASEGMSRPPLNPQFTEIPGIDRSQRGTRSFSGAMAARYSAASHCTPVPPKAVKMPAADSGVAPPGDGQRMIP